MQSSGMTHDILSSLGELEEKYNNLKLDMDMVGSILSHDIRPATGNMSEYNQQLTELHQRSKDVETKKLIKLVGNEITRSQNTLNQLIEYIRVGSSKLKPKTIDTSNILNTVLTNHAEAISQTHAIITHDNLAEIMGNRVYISHLFSHLLENALAYKKPDSILKLHIGCMHKGNIIEFYFRDNGIGIAKEFHNIVFILFQRLHTAEEIPGTGAGLALCKKMIELHGGNISLESIPDEGTTIYFSLPMAQAQTVAIPQHTYNTSIEDTNINTIQTKHGTQHNIEDDPDDETVNILLIEDMQSDADALQQALAHHAPDNDFHITTETRLESGLDYLAHNKTDIILLDLGLPDVKGIDVIDKVHQQYPTLPIIVFSGNSNKNIITEALQHGANQFLVKGECSGTILKNSIYQALATRRVC